MPEIIISLPAVDYTAMTLPELEARQNKIRKARMAVKAEATACAEARKSLMTRESVDAKLKRMKLNPAEAAELDRRIAVSSIDALSDAIKTQVSPA